MDLDALLGPLDERLGFPSASGLHRIMQCQGSRLLERGLPETTVGDDWRDEGSSLHDYAEQEIIPDHLEDEQKWAIRTALKLKNDFYEAFSLVGEVHKEKRLWAHRPDLTPLFSGKFDEAKVAESFCSICDYKFGRKPVPPAEVNIQMRAYAVLLWLQWPGREYYAVAIIQPRVEESLRFSCASYDEAQLAAAYQNFLNDITESERGDIIQRFNPSYHACEYCKALHACDAAFNFFTHVTL